MARSTFGAGMADYVVRPSDGLWAVAAGAAVTFWDAADAGTQYTDLLDAGGLPVSQIVTDEYGALPTFQGPDGVRGMWADAGGTERTWIATRDLPPDSDVLSTTIVVKPVDTSRASTATPAADPHLTLPVDANATYDVEVIAVWSTGGGGLRATWIAPTSAAMTWTDNDGVGVISPTGTVVFSSGTGTLFKGTLRTAETAGSLTFSWAQNTSNAAATILRSGCSLKLTRIA
jgi:hypothetical protein